MDLGDLAHPARLLERIGLRRAAGRLRLFRRHVYWLLPHLRPDEAATLTRYWVGERRRRRDLHVLDLDALRGARRGDTVFVFGSGRSLTEITEDEWSRIAEFDTVAFSHFHRQNWVRVDFYVVGELVPYLDDAAESFRTNPRFAHTIYGLMKGWSARSSNELVARGLLPQDARVFHWRRVGREETIPPGTRLDLVHGSNSLMDVVNFALVLGWREIVIAGVDLYNKEYFWLPPGVTRPDERPIFTAESRWFQADQMIETLRLWRQLVEPSGIRISVYNARSLLAEAIPVYRPA